MFFCLRCLTGIHVLQEGTSSKMIFCTGGHFLYEKKFNSRVYPIGSHVLRGPVLQEYM